MHPPLNLETFRLLSPCIMVILNRIPRLPGTPSSFIKPFLEFLLEIFCDTFKRIDDVFSMHISEISLYCYIDHMNSDHLLDFALLCLPACPYCLSPESSELTKGPNCSGEVCYAPL